MIKFAPLRSTSTVKGLEDTKPKPKKMKCQGPIQEDVPAAASSSVAREVVDKDKPPPHRENLGLLWREVTDEQLAAYWRYQRL